MEIGQASRVDLSAPVAPATAGSDWQPNDRQIISAVQWLNQAEWLAGNRELTYRRDAKTGRLVIQILERDTGEVVDQIPPESVLRLVTELQARLKTKDA